MIEPKSVKIGDICPGCNHGHIEIASSPRPADGNEFRVRYLRCSMREIGCKFTAKQVLPVDAIPIRRRGS